MSDQVSQVDVEVEKTYKFPKYVGFILGNEFCERYSFYGMRTILVLFLTYFIKFDEDTSTVIYHAFTVLAYLFPLMGGAIADGYWGKYKTILWLSIVYAGGMVLFSMSALPQLSDDNASMRTANAVLACAGLLVIAFGTGGIKPCVSSFGGDQFEAGDDKNTAIFFDLFYWAINAGSFVSTLLSPLIREMTCGPLGTDDSCYFLAFLIPAVLMSGAVGMFVIGTKYYKRVPPTGTNIFFEVIKTIWYGAWNKVPEEALAKGNSHWLYGASGKVEDWLIRDCKYLVRVLVMFLPLPVFWAAFDQQGSRWTLQAVRMNGYITETIKILPDQAQILNPIMILTFIPIFNALYKWINNCIKVTPLRKMGVGMIFAAAAYIVSALVQAQIDISLTVSPSVTSEMALRVVNLNDGRVISGAFNTTSQENFPLPGELRPVPDAPANINDINIGSGLVSLKFECQDGRTDASCQDGHVSTAEVLVKTALSSCSEKSVENGLISECSNVFSFDYTSDDYDENNHNVNPYHAQFEIEEGRVVNNLAVFADGYHLTYPGWSSKDSDGKARITVITGFRNSDSNAKDGAVFVEFELNCDGDDCAEIEPTSYLLEPCNFDAETKQHIVNTEPRSNDDTSVKPFLCIDGEERDDRDAIKLARGVYTAKVFRAVYDAEESGLTGGHEYTKTGLWENFDFEIGTGAAYTIVMQYGKNGDSGVTDENVCQITINQDMNVNDVSLLWIIPQFFVITVAEVMISITGLEFAYTQAPITLKSVLTSFWLLTVSVGNIVVIIVAEGKIMPSQVAEYLLFAGLILGANVIFVLLAVFYYEYVKKGEFDSFEYPSHITNVELKDEGHENDTLKLE